MGYSLASCCFMKSREPVFLGGVGAEMEEGYGVWGV